MAEKDQGLQQAIAAKETAEELAVALKITPQAISQWTRVPPLRVLDVERITGVPRHELRPDIYPTPEREGAAS